MTVLSKRRTFPAASAQNTCARRVAAWRSTRDITSPHHHHVRPSSALLLNIPTYTLAIAQYQETLTLRLLAAFNHRSGTETVGHVIKEERTELEFEFSRCAGGYGGFYAAECEGEVAGDQEGREWRER